MNVRPLLLVSLALTASLSGCVDRFLTGEVDAPVPEMDLQDIDGNPLNLSAFQDEILLLDFMGTWCGPCQRGIPFMAELSERPGISILSISGTDTTAEMRQFRDDFGVTWPMAVDDEGFIRRTIDAAGGRDRGILWPTYAIVHEERIVFFNEGETLPATFNAAIARIQGEAAVPTTGIVGPTAAAFLFGATAWFTPFLLHRTALHNPTERREMLPWLLGSLAAWTVFLAWLVGFANRFLSGRVLNLAPIVAAGAVGALLWWRLKAKDAEPKEPKSASPRRRAAGLPLDLLFHGAPGWLTVVLLSMLASQPGLGWWTQAGFGFGLAAAIVATWMWPAGRDWAERTGPALAWIGAAGWVVGAGALIVLRF